MGLRLAFLSWSLISVGLANAQQALRETPKNDIDYGSVAEALADIRAKPGIVISTVNKWTIATDEAAMTIWSFAPPDYPAYPAVVKRQVVEEGGRVSIVMNVDCEASKAKCDD